MSAFTATRPPFVDASPAEVRAALIEEERPEFDREYHAALAAAGDSYSLDQLGQVLQEWRRIAWTTTAHGPGAYRRMIARAEHTLRTGERPAESVSWRELKADLDL